MRRLTTLAVGASIALVASGCAVRDRQWGGCAVAGGIIGATLGGIGAGVGVNNVEPSPSDAERGGAIGGGIVGGGLLGALLGHVICDPVKEAPPPPPVAAPAPPPPPKPLAVLKGPHFDFDKSSLRPTGKEKVAEVARHLKEHPDMRVSVEGHTDSVGTDAYNQKLSERRAKTVRDELVMDGVEASRIATVGYGESKPAADNKTAEGRAENRRVEIIPNR